MSPRPKKATDADVFDAAYRVMARLGPAELTLAEIAGEAGVTAGALVQRFGSKRGLLLALMEAVAASADTMLTSLRAGHESPVEALYAYADCVAAMGDSPAALAHSLGWLQMDLTDPDFHRYAKAHAVAARSVLREWVEEAVAAKELKRGTDAAALARAIEVTLRGSLMTWAFYQDGSATDWLRHDLTALLEPQRPAAKPRKRRRQRR